MSLKFAQKSLQLVSEGIVNEKKNIKKIKKDNPGFKRKPKKKLETPVDLLLKKNIAHLLQEKTPDKSINTEKILEYFSKKKERHSTKKTKQQKSEFDEDDFDFKSSLFDDDEGEIEKKKIRPPIHVRKR